MRYSCFEKYFFRDFVPNIKSYKVDKQIFANIYDNVDMQIVITEKTEDYINFSMNISSPDKKNLEDSFFKEIFNPTIFNTYWESFNNTLVESGIFNYFKYGKIEKINRINNYESKSTLTTNKHKVFQSCFFDDSFRFTSKHGYKVLCCNLFVESYFHYDIKEDKLTPFFSMRLKSAYEEGFMYYTFKFRSNIFDSSDLELRISRLELYFEDYKAQLICNKFKIGIETYLNNKNSYVDLYKLDQYN